MDRKKWLALLVRGDVARAFRRNFAVDKVPYLELANRLDRYCQFGNSANK
jgi:hypothetical protein